MGWCFKNSYNTFSVGFQNRCVFFSVAVAGTSWSKDAFDQAELTLHALRLACDFLRPGGTFVSKAWMMCWKKGPFKTQMVFRKENQLKT